MQELEMEDPAIKYPVGSRKNKNKKKNGLEEKIKKVKLICPDIDETLIIQYLNYNNGNVENTINYIFEKSYNFK